MTADPDRNYRCLLRLCQAVRAGPDLRTVFLQAAEAVRELPACEQVALIPASGTALGPGFAVDWPGPPRCSDLPPEDSAAPAVAWVLEHRQPRAEPPAAERDTAAGR